jgi:hypothetical protein
MGTIIVKAAVVRKPGFLYYVDKNGSVCEAKMTRTGRKKGTGKKKAILKVKKVVVKKAAKKPVKAVKKKR